jgi:RHH-type rel operon transcriptional repressor/antitoxin RelB
MSANALSIRLDQATKARLKILAQNTGRSRALLAAEAIEEYLDLTEWQAAGIVGALALLQRRKGVPHQRVKEWLAAHSTRKERR